MVRHLPDNGQRDTGGLFRDADNHDNLRAETSGRWQVSLDHDRRRAPRRSILLRLAFDYADKAVKCVATNINHLGTFINTQVVPPVGTRLVLAYTSDKAPAQSILFKAVVVRVVHQTLRASRTPGMAVAFDEIASTGGADHLCKFLDSSMQCRPGDYDRAEFATNDAGYAALRVEGADTGGSEARHVHEKRLKDGKYLPTDGHETENLMRKFTGTERRRNPRFSVRVDVSFYCGDIPFLGSVLNISQSSLFMQTDHDIPAVGTNVSLKFPLAEAPDPQYVRIDGTICRHWDPSNEALPGYAVHFDHVGELGRRGIFQMYLNNFRKRASSPRTRRGFHYSRRR